MRASAVRLVILTIVVAGIGMACSWPTTSFRDGFYDEEPSLDGSTFRWMGEEGNIALQPSTSAMVLEISMIVPLDQLAEAPTVTIELNDKVLDKIAVADRNVTKRYEIPGGQASNESHLKIRTTQTFVPAQRDTSSQDQRRLGLIVSSVQWTPKS